MIGFAQTIRRHIQARRLLKRIDPTGVKRWYVPGTSDTVLTPYAAKERNRRRRATRSATVARKRNRLVAQRAKRKRRSVRRRQGGGKA